MITAVKVVRIALATLALVGANPGGSQPAAPAPPAGPAPTGLVVGSGNFYSPIVANLDEAVAFYRAIGFDVQGEPANADQNLELRAMFGLPDARLRWQIGRAAPTPGGVEVIEISGAGGEKRELGVRDPGAVMLLVIVRDLDGTFARVKQLGAQVVSSGGGPIALDGGIRAVVVRDPAGHLVQLLRGPNPPQAAEGANPNIAGVRVQHTVGDLPRSLALYRDALALKGGAQVPPWVAAPSVLGLFGLPYGQEYRFALLNVPTSGLGIQLIEFAGVRPPPAPANVADPGSTRMQLRVTNVDAAAAAIVRAGGAVVSTGGKSLELPAGNGTLKVAMVRDPDGLFLVLIQAPPAP